MQRDFWISSYQDWGESMGKKILILGSCNVDLVFNIPRFHRPGETILAESQVTFFGGKGANQAVTSKRLGGNVCFITKVGNDPYGESYRQHLIKNGLDRKLILKDKTSNRNGSDRIDSGGREPNHCLSRSERLSLRKGSKKAAVLLEGGRCFCHSTGDPFSDR